MRPRLLIAGGSSYPRTLDFERLARAAGKVGAHFMVDMAHVAGLVAGGVHPSPIPHADLVTCTTTKTLRGPRGGMILARDGTWSKKLESAVFRGAGEHPHAGHRGEGGVDYARRVKNNAAKLAAVLAGAGIGVVTGGTDTHVVLLDLSPIGLSGQSACSNVPTSPPTRTRFRSTCATRPSGADCGWVSQPPPRVAWER